MDPASPTRRLNQYTKIVLSTIEGIAQSYKVPLLTTTAALSLGIVTMIESVRINKKLCIQIADDTQVLCNIVRFYVEKQTDGFVPPKFLHDIASLAEILQTIFSCLKLQQGMGRFKTLFKQMDNKMQLERCADALSVCVKMFDFNLLISKKYYFNLQLQTHRLMRRAERPGKVQWSCPFLAALSPLNNLAAIKTFYDIAGDLHCDPALVDSLLQLTGNLPLAIPLKLPPWPMLQRLMVATTHFAVGPLSVLTRLCSDGILLAITTVGACGCFCLQVAVRGQMESKVIIMSFQNAGQNVTHDHPTIGRIFSHACGPFEVVLQQ
ncbi:hypothetical protein B0H16DRAFT_1473287 [Mycena metata]|uniref:Uncharacterized protein n=1 Tax=Mycena metata TaxID=1033252 RepID=A0AAD7HKV4_9AGAR|nr:hypothetical protein B0H16DRAFT_1473287 [Mycena metata]